MPSVGYPLDDRTAKSAAVKVRRGVNDEIARMGAALQVSITNGFEFVCECGDLRCRGVVKLTLAEFRALAPGSVVSHSPTD